MQNLRTIHQIISLFAIWRCYTEFCSSVLLNDVNNTNEDLAVLILNKTYGWKLENLNTKHSNYPAIDLGDINNKIGISVTATNSSTYICEKIKINIRHKIYETYPNHYFFITTKKKNYTRDFDTQGKYTFDKDTNIFDINDLLTKIKVLSIETQNDILNILEDNVSKFTGNFIEDITPQDIANLLEEFSVQSPNLINYISDEIRTIHRTDFLQKNELNNLSENYIKFIQQHSLPFFEQLKTFLEKFENKNFKNIYLNITSDLQKVILINKFEFDKFDDIFNVIEESCKSKAPKLVEDRRNLLILLHFMYFQCDIGENQNVNTR